MGDDGGVVRRYRLRAAAPGGGDGGRGGAAEEEATAGPTLEFSLAEWCVPGGAEEAYLHDTSSYGGVCTLAAHPSDPSVFAACMMGFDGAVVLRCEPDGGAGLALAQVFRYAPRPPSASTGPSHSVNCACFAARGENALDLCVGTSVFSEGNELPAGSLALWKDAGGSNWGGGGEWGGVYDSDSGSNSGSGSGAESDTDSDDDSADSVAEPDWTFALDHPPYAMDASGELVCAAAGHHLTILDAATGELVSVMAAEVPLCAVKFSPDGSLVAGGGDESVSVWSVDQGCVRFQLRPRQERTASCCGPLKGRRSGLSPRGALPPQQPAHAASVWRHAATPSPRHPATPPSHDHPRHATRHSTTTPPPRHPPFCGPTTTTTTNRTTEHQA